MANGHARAKHGPELGNPSPAAYRARVGRHLDTAPTGVAFRDPNGNTRYLLADATRNEVAWVVPHKEHRSTFFSPRGGAADYVRARQAAGGPDRGRSVDLAAARERARTPVHRVVSADRSSGRGGSARVP